MRYIVDFLAMTHEGALCVEDTLEIEGNVPEDVFITAARLRKARMDKMAGRDPRFVGNRLTTITVRPMQTGGE